MTTPALIKINGCEVAIPMDSPYFVQVNGEWFFKVGFKGLERLYGLRSQDLLPIIAAVAHLYWITKAGVLEQSDPVMRHQYRQYASAWAQVAQGGKHV